MKALHYISFLMVLILGACSSRLYVGSEYDDLYYVPSDNPKIVREAPLNEQIAQGNLKAEPYYDNIYAADTLISDRISDAVDYDEVNVYNNNNTSAFEYMDDLSYTNRLSRFYGNYFNPYWRDPFYSWGYSPFSFSFNYGFGFPYWGSRFNYSPYYYDPFYYDPFYYGS